MQSANLEYKQVTEAKRKFTSFKIKFIKLFFFCWIERVCMKFWPVSYMFYTKNILSYQNWSKPSNFKGFFGVNQKAPNLRLYLFFLTVSLSKSSQIWNFFNMMHSKFLTLFIFVSSQALNFYPFLSILFKALMSRISNWFETKTNSKLNGCSMLDSITEKRRVRSQQIVLFIWAVFKTWTVTNRIPWRVLPHSCSKRTRSSTRATL